MAISTRTRRMLWGLSGARCALCRRRLVEGGTALSAESVVGEEAHIVARSPGGPRHEPLPGNSKDEFGNLLLLCPPHHKQVDDQVEEFPVWKLRQIKNEHERWVTAKLDTAQVVADSEATPVPALLIGSDVWSVIAGAHAYDFQGLDEPNAPQKLVDASDAFLQEARDWGEISEDVKLQGFGSVRDAKRSLGNQIDELRALGLRIFGMQTPRAMPQFGEGVQFCVSMLIIAKMDDPRIGVNEPSDKVSR